MRIITRFEMTSTKGYQKSLTFDPYLGAFAPIFHKLFLSHQNNIETLVERVALQIFWAQGYAIGRVSIFAILV